MDIFIFTCTLHHNNFRVSLCSDDIQYWNLFKYEFSKKVGWIKLNVPIGKAIKHSIKKYIET